MSIARWLPAAALTVLVAACSGPAPTRSPTAVGPAVEASPSDESTAEEIAPDPRIGAVVAGGQTLHVCSGSVLDTPAGDLILTAAHCLADGVDTYFVPGFTDDSGADDFWTVDAVYLDPRWVQRRDPLADFAIARVSRDGGGRIEDRVGTGLSLGETPPTGTEVTVHGYAFGVGGDQLGCRAHTTMHGAFPELPCAGLVAGTSGSPWVAGSATVTGVVGGLEGGGCDENVSYSAPFDSRVRQVLARAEQGGPGDTAPTVFDDDC